jgi:hypothetical protein
VGAASITTSDVSGTLPSSLDGRFGDGVDIFNTGNVYLVDSLVADNSRCGVVNFGSSLFYLGGVYLLGNLFHVCAEPWNGQDWEGYDDGGGNVCGAILNGQLFAVVCQVTSPGLEPPEPIPVDQP